MFNFYYVLLIITLFNIIKSAPIKDDYTDDVQDQRQNGTENYRIDMKDVLIVFSPLDSLLTAALATDPLDKPDDLNLGLFADLKHDTPQQPKQNR